ncbi:hypothetical protein [Thioclava nitratireducens]|uniref:hypothetical protein n=1 Tax=Thioclava nitratireducens TaxID=1915078 RepID=UPI002481944C|nr:hypothetical protein [Thioclava nitratireducens]WGT52631.1 hypothetical protein P0N61_20300 [Thioclava nitratireducens]
MPDSSTTLGEASLPESRRVSLSVAADDAEAPGIASTLAAALAEFRADPRVAGIEFSQQMEGATQRFRLALRVHGGPENGTDPLETLARDIGASTHVETTVMGCVSSARNAAPPTSAQKIPAFWKRWTVSMIAVYPALIGLVYGLTPVTAGMPKPLSLFIVALLLTGLNARYLVPFLNRHLQGWLFK